MIQKQSTRLAELDALRGIAATLVVLFHYTMNTGHAERLFNLGVTGVDLFFMISGFVIFMTISRITTAKQFIISRVARLYPAYWFCVTLHFAINLIFGSIQLSKASFINYGANLTMLQNYFLQKHIDGVYWTLVVELLFYALALGLFVSNQLRRFEQIGFVLVVLLLVYGNSLSNHMGVWTMRIYRFLSLADFFPLFLSGVVYYKMKFEAKTPFRFILLIFCIISQVSLFHLAGDRYKWFDESIYIWLLLTYNALFLLYSYGQLGFIVNRVTIFLGTISYAMYLTHGMVGYIFAEVFHLTDDSDSFWFEMVVKICVMIFISYFIHLFVEQPALTYAKEHWLRRKRQVLVQD